MKGSFSVVGLGRVGTALTVALKKRGYSLKGVVDLDPGALERCRGILGGVPFALNLENLEPGDVILVTVRDDAISHVASRLRALFPGTLLVHTSGLHPSRVLGEGPRLSMHPLQSFASVEEALENLPRSFFSLEGDPYGLEWGKRVVEDLGGRWMVLEASQKSLYHLAACIASNYLVTLLHQALKAMERAGLEGKEVLPGLLALMRGTLKNVERLGVPGALTGPMVRGDVGTIESHLKALEGLDDLKDFYSYMGAKTLEMIKEGGLNTPSEALEAMEVLVSRGKNRNGGR